MTENTKIEWCDATFNPWIGCTKVGPGCDNCYAATQDNHRKWTPEGWGAGMPRKRTRPANWNKPRQWDKKAFYECPGCGWRGDDPSTHSQTGLTEGIPSCPDCDRLDLQDARRRVFCASLADVFDNEVDPQWRHDLFALIIDTPVIYENPKLPIQDAGWGAYMDENCVVFADPSQCPTSTRGSLRRIVRLSDPAYYCAENPQTDSEGFLPHDGERKVPAWVEGKLVEAKRYSGFLFEGHDPIEIPWGRVVAYRIVGEQEDQRPELPNEGRNQEQEDVEEGLALLRKHSWDLYEKSGASENGDDPEQFASGDLRETAERIVQFICESVPVPETLDAQDVLTKHNLEHLICIPPNELVKQIENALENEELEAGLGLLRKYSWDLMETSDQPAVDKPRSPSDASDEQFTADDLQFIFQDGRIGVGISPRTEAGGSQVLKWMPEPQGHTTRHPEARHRNELAARTLTTVPGMDLWMHDVIAKARKIRGLKDE